MTSSPRGLHARRQARRPPPPTKCAHGADIGGECIDCAVARDRKALAAAAQVMARAAAEGSMPAASAPVHTITPMQRELSVLPMLDRRGRVTVVTSISHEDDETNGLPCVVIVERWDADGTRRCGRYRLEDDLVDAGLIPASVANRP